MLAFVKTPYVRCLVVAPHRVPELVHRMQPEWGCEDIFLYKTISSPLSAHLVKRPMPNLTRANFASTRTLGKDGDGCQDFNQLISYQQPGGVATERCFPQMALLRACLCMCIWMN